MEPWNGWYHITGNTYGSWLPGDPRGWKTRHARDPPGALRPLPAEDRERLHEHSKRIGGAPVILSSPARSLVLERMLIAFQYHDVEVIAASIGGQHFHILGRFEDRPPRTFVGIAKKESARALSRAGLADPGGVWAVRTHCKPIRDRPHQVDVARYIASHIDEGAATWVSWLQPPNAHATS